ncbi:MAG: hypothetical protein H6972_02160 [Gammaproteobacteria bacterium]|nr:hypothetical protein [Gammaproteobacteria bacterium]
MGRGGKDRGAPLRRPRGRGFGLRVFAGRALAGDGGDDGRCGCGTWREGLRRTASKATRRGFGLRVFAGRRWLATGGDDRTVRLWDVARRVEAHCFEGHTGEVLACGFSPDGRWLATAGRDRRCGCGTWPGGWKRTAAKASR